MLRLGTKSVRLPILDGRIRARPRKGENHRENSGETHRRPFLGVPRDSPGFAIHSTTGFTTLSERIVSRSNAVASPRGDRVSSPTRPATLTAFPAFFQGAPTGRSD